MLRLALVFLVIALIASLFSFGLIADFSFTAAKVLFFLFLIAFLVSLVVGWRGRGPRV